MPKGRWFLFPILVFGIGTSARAGVIDFETGAFVLNFGQTGSLQGFNFTTGGQPVSVLLVPVTAGICQPSCISDGTQTLAALNGADVLIDPITPGEVFTLDSFDVAGTAQTGSNRNATSIQVIGNLSGGGQVTQTFFIDPDSFQTETLDSSFAGLSSMEFDGLAPVGLSSPEFQLDNIVYTTQEPTIPEPGTLVLVGAGLFAIAIALFRSERLRLQR